MKLSSALILLLGTSFPLVGQSSIAEQDEITVLLELIESSKKNLQDQHKLLKLILDFKKAREDFIGEPTSAKRATHLVKMASQVHEEIEKNHLAHLFAPDFLLEIRFFTEVGHKQTLSKEKA